jgi:capsular polysaccharide biosynthesis protein
MTRNPALTASLPEADPQPPYLLIITRWLLIAAGFFFLTMFAGLYITEHVLQKVYMATAQIQLKSKDLSTVRNLVPDVSQEDFDADFFHHELEVMVSPDVLLPIIKDLHLDTTWAKRVYHTEGDQMPDKEALAYMGRMVHVDFQRGTNLVDIWVSSPDPLEAAGIADAIANQYLKLRHEAGDVSENHVHIVTRAQVPSEPVKPNKSLDFAVTVVIAVFLSICGASFVEVAVLISRASQRPA